MLIPNKILEVVDYVLQYATSTDNWLSVKKEIMWNLPPSDRKKFSRRHYSTHKHSINDLEQLLISYWYEQTGIKLSIPENLKHDPTWTRHRRGWGLKRYNKERQKNAEKRKQATGKTSRRVDSGNRKRDVAS